MGFLAKTTAIVASLGIARVCAGPAPAPEPVITPAAILPRATTQTLGWYSDGQTSGETIYAPWVYDADTITYTSSGSYLRRCQVSANCVMYTGCLNGYMVAASTSSYCGISGATGGTASNYCSNHVLFPTLGAATGGLSWYWCDSAPLTGLTFYARQPAQPTLTAASSSRSTQSVTSTTVSGSTSRSPTPTPTPPAADNSSNNGTPVGAIVGGVVGGVAVLAAIALAILWIMRRDKKKKGETVAAYQSAPLIGAHTSYQQNPGYPPQPDYYAAGAYQDNEQKPQGVVQQGYYPQSYPLAPYSPHAPQQYPGSPPPQELSAPVEFPPQELPAQQNMNKPKLGPT